MFTRGLRLPAPGTETFFLWGPRQTGKTTLLRQAYAGACWVDLLKADEFRRYVERPELLRQELEARPAPTQVVIDEIQKVPALLDEVHWLMERRRIAFALCGSSARKVRRGGANLLGGRAIRYELFGDTTTAAELWKGLRAKAGKIAPPKMCPFLPEGDQILGPVEQLCPIAWAIR